MVKENPESELSIKRPVTIYTIVALVSFAILLIFLANDRYNNFVEAHQQFADKAVQVATAEISQIIANKRRSVSYFAEDNQELILELSYHPDDIELYDLLNLRISRTVPDFFASNIVASTGEFIIGDFDGKIGELCLADIHQFIDSGRQLVRVHPNNDTYHYDILTRLPDGNDGKLFFVSFNLNELANLLRLVQPVMHELLLLNEDMQNLIEINSQGGRNVIADRLDYRFTDDELSRIMSSAKIDGTVWHVVDLHQPGLLADHRTRAFSEYLVVYLVVFVVGLYMRSVLVSRDNRRNLAEIRLRQSNNEITVLNDKLELLAITDSLTGLHNRRYADQQLQMEWSRCQRTGTLINIAIIDIDYFKDYNDRYGHQAGDDCLVAVANIMASVFKRAGDTVARYGGEEFIAIMKDVSIQQAERVLHQFQSALKNIEIQHQSSMTNGCLTVSIGLYSIAPKPSDSIQDAINKADKALYMAKESGRNQVYVYK